MPMRTEQARSQRRDASRNVERLVTAAARAVLRDGPRVPMATIAQEAGVGVGTLYRHFPSRRALLDELTRRSFVTVQANANTADREATHGVDALRRFVEAAVDQRNDLVLPLHGGPPVASAEVTALRAQVHETVERMLARGRADGTIREDASPDDVIALGALLAQPRPVDPTWDATARRLLAVYLRGLAPERG